MGTKKKAVEYEAKRTGHKPAKKSHAGLRRERIKALDFDWADAREEPRNARIMVRIRSGIYEWCREYCERIGISASAFVEGAIRREVRRRKEFYALPERENAKPPEDGLGPELEYTEREREVIGGVNVSRTNIPAADNGGGGEGRVDTGEVL